ncbi:MAG TPA: SAV_6107 family HEPN domain-containing protein [Jiangellaceae bacterium]
MADHRSSGAAGRHRGRTGHAVVDLIDHARDGLAQAAGTASAGERYAAAHLAALRAGAAVLAARSRPVRAARSRRGRSRGPRNVWVDLAQVAPELAEWSEFFAAGASKRAAAQAGLPRAVTARDADDMLREADSFLALVCGLLGLPYQQPLSGAAIGICGG